MRVRPFLICVLLALPVTSSQAMARFESCLDKVEHQAREYAACRYRFGGNDNRCRLLANELEATKKQCRQDGDTQEQIENAATRGYRVR